MGIQKYSIGQKVWIVRNGKPQEVEIENIMVASDGENIYEFHFRLDNGMMCSSGRGESVIYETQDEALKIIESENKERIKERKEITDKVFKSIGEGNIVFITEEGFFESPIEEFVQQPLDGMLYDLNRNEAVIRTDANKDTGWRWVHDLSLIKLLEYYYNKTNKVSD